MSTLQSSTAELSKVGDELATVKKERSSLQAKVVQLTTALKSALATKVGLDLGMFDYLACLWWIRIVTTIWPAAC